MTEGAVPREVRPHQGRRAGVATRTVSAVLDAFVALAILLLGYGTVAGLAFLVDPLTFHFPALSRQLNLSAALAVIVGYLTVAWTTTGRTCGALVMGLRLIDPGGRPPRLIRALLRALACALFPVGLLWSAADARNRSIQDVMLRTSVVYDWSR